ncbi:MAG: YdcF family protein [Chloroflexi bacterium]|nr:YdcF family protein [Chloroflexota bacterium]
METRRPGGASRARRFIRLGALSSLGIALLLAALILSAGFVVEGFQPTLEVSDAIVVISGDEQLARLAEGVRLWRDGWAPELVLSGAAGDGGISNAAAMRVLAERQGVRPSAILLDELAEDTYGNAVHTRRLLERDGVRSLILVTSPYHLQRATRTFNAVYAGSGVRVIARAAPDSEWRKQSWWMSAHQRELTNHELAKLAYILFTGHYN